MPFKLPGDEDRIWFKSHHGIDAQLARPEDLAAIVMDDIELRRSARPAGHSERRLLALAHKEKDGAEHLARTLQATPATAVAQHPRCRCGGGVSTLDSLDRWRFPRPLPLPDGARGIVMGDVCGKGAEAAALTAAVGYRLRSAANQSGIATTWR